MNVSQFSNLPALIAVERDAVRWLMPAEPTAAGRAAAGAESVRMINDLIIGLMRAGIIGASPDDPFARQILNLEAEIRSEAAALASWATMPNCDDEPAPADD